jgi:NADH-quinone oxidoreductase subunit J
MNLHDIMFILFSAVILVFSVLTVTSRRILRAATYLLFVLISTAGLYFMLKYEFLAAVQVALYAGGIVVLIIFSILLTHHIDHKFERPGIMNAIAGIAVAVVGSATVITTLLGHTFTPGTAEPLNVTVNTIGHQLVSTQHNGYSLPFEVISILLLAALIAGIVIARKESTPSETEKK